MIYRWLIPDHVFWFRIDPGEWAVLLTIARIYDIGMDILHGAA